MEDDYEKVNQNVCRFISDNYNLNVKACKWLKSHEDTNILVEKRDLDSTEICPSKFVFKVFKGAGPSIGKYHQIAQCLLHLRSRGFHCSSFICGKNGEYLQDFTSYVPDEWWDLGEKSLLITYQPGVELDNSGLLSEELVQFELGALLGHFHHCLRDMKSECVNLQPDPSDPWFAGNVRLLNQDYYLQMIRNPEKREEVKKMIETIERSLSSSSSALGAGIVHGDFHGYNLIVQPRGSSILSRLSSSSLSLRQNKDSAISPSAAKLGESQSLILSTVKDNGLCVSENYLGHILETFEIIDFNETCISYYFLEVGRLIADLMVTILYKKRKLQTDTQIEEQDRRSDSNSEDRTTNDGGKKSENVNVDHPAIASSELQMAGLTITGDKVQVDTASEQVVVDSGKQDDGSDSETDAPDTEISESDLFQVLQIGGTVLAGYMMTNSLCDEELGLLKESLLITFLQYHLLGLRTMMDVSENTEYLGMCVQEAGALLFQLSRMEKTTLESVWAESARSFLLSQKQKLSR